MNYTAPIEPPDILTADHVVALNLRLFRVVSKLTMEDVGVKLEQYSGKAYTPQSISYWELSASKPEARPCSVQELVGLSVILSVPTATLVTPPSDEAWLTKPVLGADGKTSEWLYAKFTEGGSVAEMYNNDRHLMLMHALINHASLYEVYDETEAP
jgi:hypothetical protein